MPGDSDSASVFQKLLASGSILVVGLFLQQALGFGGRLIIARFLGKVDYGAVSLGLTLAMTVSILVVLGTDNGVGRYLPRYDASEKRRGVLTSAFQIVVPLAVLAGVAVAAAADPIARYGFNDPSVAPVIRVFAAVIPLAALVRLTVGSIRGMQESLPRVYIEHITLPTVRFALIGVAVWAGFGAVGVAAAYAAAYGVAAVISAYYLTKHTPLVGEVSPEPMHRDLLEFSAPLMVTATMTLVLANLDTFMLGYFSSTGDVGIYNVIYPLARFLQIVLIGFNFLLMPVVSERQSNDEMGEVRRMYQVVAKWIAIVTLPLFLTFAFFPDLVIRWTFGPEYVAGGFALSVLAAGFFINAVAGPSGNILMALGSSRLLMYVNVVTAGVNAALNLYLIPRYSFVGAAVATVAGYLVMNGLFVLLLYRDIDAHPFTSALLRPTIAAAGVWTALAWVVRSEFQVTLLAYFGLLVAFLPLYAVVVVRFGGIEQEEIQLLTSFEERLGVDLGPVRRFAARLAD